MIAAGFHHRNVSGLDMFVEHPDASTRDAVHVVFVGRVERPGDEPNPDIEPMVRAAQRSGWLMGRLILAIADLLTKLVGNRLQLLKRSVLETRCIAERQS